MPDVDRGSAVPRAPDWRDRTSYAELQDFSGEGWAWEFLGRNPDYRIACRSDDAKTCVADARSWGLVTFRLAGVRERPLWRPEVSPSVIRFYGSVDAVVARLGRCRTTIVRERGDVVHLLAEHAGVAIQLVVMPLSRRWPNELLLAADSGASRPLIPR